MKLTNNSGIEGEEMSNVFQFPTAATTRQAENDPVSLDALADRARAAIKSPLARKAGSNALGGLVVMLSSLRMAVFVLLSFVRPVVRWVCNGVWPLTLLLGGFAFYAFPERPVMWHGLLGISLATFVLGLAFDYLLMWVAPGDAWMTL